MPDTTTDRLGLDYLMPAQAQKHVTVNEALRTLDALVQARVLDRTLGIEPAAPAGGDAYILPAGASGTAWADFAEQEIAVFQDGAWQALSPQTGWTVFDQAAGETVLFDGTSWRPLAGFIGELSNLARLGVGTAADSANPLSAKLNAALFTALETGAGGNGDLRYTLNKEAASHVLSLLFQSGWSGRAEIGLIGNDDLAVKLSADGTGFAQVLTATAEGKLGVNTATPVDALHVKNAGDIKTRILVENDRNGANGQAQIQAKSDIANFFILSHGSSVGITRWGEMLDGWNEFLSFSGNGLSVGTFGAQPVLIGTDKTARLALTGTGELGVFTSSPAEKVDIDADALRLRQSRTPASASAPGAAGTLCWDSDYLYICVATDSWKRAPLSSW